MMRLRCLSVGLLALAALALFVSGCDKESGQKDDRRELEKMADSAQGHMAEGNYVESEKVSLDVFQKLYKEDPRDPRTWEAFLRVCEARAKLGKPNAAACYDRFFDETKNIEVNPDVKANALRWRLVIALQNDNKPEAIYYWTMLEPIYTKARAQGRVSLEIQAYTEFLYSGVLEFQDRVNEAIKTLEGAIAKYEKSSTKDPRPIFDYMFRLIMFQREAKKYRDALLTVRKREEMLKRTYGNRHPELAYNKLLLVNVLLDLGDYTTARAEWEYVANLLGGIRPELLPKEINEMLGSTMVRLDTMGTFTR